ncbi:carbohydrate ABC transporter permease [Vallitalea pronyensis]|uniref:Carbohydrate ABC transporter permease n=1 Tax=Vallitalea pronyensis TaxID=1348613 RepID=A0A8J8SGP1_9FIRM|nr:carbohydrate ABC transporter permease [Vallitalea pronyensis]QUI22811.1 carbohydrate ABC transporter permease [Vallitalea pronyensis]
MKKKWPLYVVSLLCVIPVVLAIIPFVIMVLTSFTQNTDIGLRFNFNEMNVVNYKALYRNFNFLNSLKNSIIVVSCACFFNCLIASMAGYGFAKKEFFLKEQIFWIYLITLMVPGQAIIVPLFIIMNKLDLLNTYTALFVPIINAFGVFLTKQFIEAVPDELLEAARIDGCGEIRSFFSVIIPLIKPVLISLTVFTFVTSWNDFIWPLVTVNNSKMNTLTLSLSLLQGNYSTNYGLLMAGTTVTFLPPFILYVILQKQFVEGIALNGLKG